MPGVLKSESSRETEAQKVLPFQWNVFEFEPGAIWLALGRIFHVVFKEAVYYADVEREI